MVQLKQQVYLADKRGSGVEPALQNLQLYVTNHMNTDISGPSGVSPPIQLKYTYNRQREMSLQAPDHNDFYTEAQNYCQAKYPVESSLYVWRGYVACVQKYLKSHDVKIKVSTNNLPVALYEFDFASPAWSPDLAGWSLVVTALFLVLAIIFGLADWWYKRQLED